MNRNLEFELERDQAHGDICRLIDRDMLPVKKIKRLTEIYGIHFKEKFSYSQNNYSHKCKSGESL